MIRSLLFSAHRMDLNGAVALSYSCVPWLVLPILVINSRLLEPWFYAIARLPMEFRTMLWGYCMVTC
jgi:hypothetical protein